MGSKAEYEAKKAAKQAKRAAEEAAKRQAVIGGGVVKTMAAPAGDDHVNRHSNGTPDRRSIGTPVVARLMGP